MKKPLQNARIRKDRMLRQGATGNGGRNQYDLLYCRSEAVVPPPPPRGSCDEKYKKANYSGKRKTRRHEKSNKQKLRTKLAYLVYGSRKWDGIIKSYAVDQTTELNPGSYSSPPSVLLQIFPWPITFIARRLLSGGNFSRNLEGKPNCSYVFFWKYLLRSCSMPTCRTTSATSIG